MSSTDATRHILTPVNPKDVGPTNCIFLTEEDISYLASQLCYLCCPRLLQDTLRLYLGHFYKHAHAKYADELANSRRSYYAWLFVESDFSQTRQFISAVEICAVDAYQKTDGVDCIRVKPTLNLAELKQQQQQESSIEPMRSSRFHENILRMFETTEQTELGFYFQDEAHLIQFMKFCIAGSQFLPVSHDFQYLLDFDRYILDDKILLAAVHSLVKGEEFEVDPIDLETIQENQLDRFYPFRAEYEEMFRKMQQIEYDHGTLPNEPVSHWFLDSSLFKPPSFTNLDNIYFDSKPALFLVEDDIDVLNGNHYEGDLEFFERRLKHYYTGATKSGTISIHNPSFPFVAPALKHVFPNAPASYVRHADRGIGGPAQQANESGDSDSESQAADEANDNDNDNDNGDNDYESEVDDADTNEILQGLQDSMMPGTTQGVDFLGSLRALLVPRDDVSEDNSYEDSDSEDESMEDSDEDFGESDAHSADGPPLMYPPSDEEEEENEDDEDFEIDEDQDEDDEDEQDSESEIQLPNYPNAEQFATPELPPDRMIRVFLEGHNVDLFGPQSQIYAINEFLIELQRFFDTDESGLEPPGEEMPPISKVMLKFVQCTNAIDNVSLTFGMFLHRTAAAMRPAFKEFLLQNYYMVRFFRTLVTAAWQTFSEHFPKDTDNGDKALKTGAFGNAYIYKTEKDAFIAGAVALAVKKETDESYEFFSPDLSRMLYNQEIGFGTDAAHKSKPDGVGMSMRFIPKQGCATVAVRQSGITAGKFSGDGSIYVAADNDYELTIFDTTDALHPRFLAVTLELDIGNWIITDLAVNRPGTLIAATSLHNRIAVVKPSDPADPANWDTRFNSPTVSYVSLGGQGRTFSVDIGAGSKTIVAGTSSQTFHVLNVQQDGRIVRNSGKHEHLADVNSVKFADDSEQLVLTGCDDSYVRLWDLRLRDRNRLVQVMRGHQQGITSVDAKGDGRFFMSSGKDQAIKLWDSRCVGSSLEVSDAFRNVDFDYRRHFYDESRQVWQGKDESLQTFRGHEVNSTLIRAYFSPVETTGAQYVYSGSADGSVFIWHVNGTHVKTVRPHHRVWADEGQPSPHFASTRRGGRRGGRGTTTNGSHFSYSQFRDAFQRRRAGPLNVIARDVAWHPRLPTLYTSFTYDYAGGGSASNPILDGSMMRFGEVAQVPFQTDSGESSADFSMPFL